MKKILYLLIPIILATIIVFSIIKIFILADTGKGALQVTSKPFSKVYLDDEYIGTTPLCRCEPTNMLKNGEYTLRLIPVDGKTKEFQDTIKIAKGVLTVVDRKFGVGVTSEGSIVSLEAIDEKDKSELLVVTMPSKADVYLDSNYQGTSPHKASSVTDSDHALRIKKDGYKDKNVRIRTPKGFRLVAIIYLGLLDEIATPIISPIASPSSALTPKPSIVGTSKITILKTPNGFLRVRSEPSLTSNEISRVIEGQSFDLIEEISGWYKIKLEDDKNGWISADYASKVNN